MKHKLVFLALVGAVLGSCSKTSELYKRSDFNSPIFDENYYTNWDGVNEFKTTTVNAHFSNLNSETSHGEVKLTNGNIDYNPNKYVYRDDFSIDNANTFGYNYCLSKTATNKEFKYGITSKLFDGRVWCDHLFQLSRVQVDKSGFAMKFSKYLVNARYLAFSVRGGTDYADPNAFKDEKSNKQISINFTWSFYRKIDDNYEKVSFNLPKVSIPVDDNTTTALVSFMPFLDEDFSSYVNGAEAMSFEWNCNDLNDEVTDDYTIKEKHHLALMLYEVFIGESEWR